ncbi:MAG: hypothetical protein LBD05_01715, partial [Mycoplasmataceae bacterium]|nr:hypothetical protein [Mycoplasmataceae bacterium]
PLVSSLSIYQIKEATPIAHDKKSIFDVIKEEDYDLHKFPSEIKKIEWICDNFKVTTKELIKQKK